MRLHERRWPRPYDETAARRRTQPQNRHLIGQAAFHSCEGVTISTEFGRGPPRPLPGARHHMELPLITPAYAQAASGMPSTETLIQFVPFVLIFVIMWFLIIRPQQRRAREHQDMIKAVRRGDTVVSSGGIVGRVTKVTEDPEIEIEIADNVRVKLMRGMIAEVRTKGEPVKS